MKTIKMKSFLFFFLFLIMACSKNETEKLIEQDFSYNFQIKSIEPLSGDLSRYITKYSDLLKSQGYEPDFTNSEIVTYLNMEGASIFIPLNESLKSGGSTSSLVFFEINNEILDFELIVTETILDDETARYIYSSVYGEFFVQFDVQLTDGLVFDVILSKSWGDRWLNCVEWTFNQMNHWHYLACMAAGKLCAGSIASMCAIGATEGYFETADGP